jgi:hypothetical protein
MHYILILQSIVGTIIHIIIPKINYGIYQLTTKTNKVKQKYWEFDLEHEYTQSYEWGLTYTIITKLYIFYCLIIVLDFCSKWVSLYGYCMLFDHVF